MSPTAEDVVECHLSLDGRTVHRLSVDLQGAVKGVRYDAETLKESAWNAAGVSAAVLKEKKSFVTEIRVPFRTFGAKVRPEGTWRVNFVRRGPSCGGFSSWAPTNREQMDFESFGTLAFEGAADEAVGEPLAENLGKKTFLWTNGPWAKGRPDDRPPLERKELSSLAIAGPRGARAVASFRVSNLTDRPALYNLDFGCANTNFGPRVRFREVGFLELRSGEVIPDPIFELPIGSVLRIAPKATAIVWVDVDLKGFYRALRQRAVLRLVPGYSGFEEKNLELVFHVGESDVGEIKMPVWYYYNLHGAGVAPLVRDYGFNVFTLLPQKHFREAGCEKGCTGRELRGLDEIDREVERLVAYGLSKDEIRFIFYGLWPKWSHAGLDRADMKRLKFLDPEWKERYAVRLKAAINHLKEKHGIGYDRLYFSTNDEPKGDPDDPTTVGYAAIHGGEFIRSVDPQLRLLCNPWANEPQYYDRYFKTFDVLQPYIRRVMDGTEDRSNMEKYRDSGLEIWSYLIFVKQNTIHQYRRGFWANLDYGFTGGCAVYGLVQASGDPFNSHDSSKKGGGTSDYNAGYRNARTDQIAPSLRLESWYQGLIDMKLAKLCRKRLEARKAGGGDVSKTEKKLAELIRESNARGADFDSARARLLAISEGLSR